MIAAINESDSIVNWCQRNRRTDLLFRYLSAENSIDKYNVLQEIQKIKKDMESKNNTPEKEYHFMVSTGGSESRLFTIKESELTQQYKDLLLGQAMHGYDELTSELKDAFNRYIKSAEAGAKTHDEIERQIKTPVKRTVWVNLYNSEKLNGCFDTTRFNSAKEADADHLEYIIMPTKYSFSSIKLARLGNKAHPIEIEE